MAKSAKAAKSAAATQKSTSKSKNLHEEGEKVVHAVEGIKKKSSSIRQEFIEFINRGSVVDLAIGVAVGGAFNNIVNSLVNDIVMPIVGLIAGGVDFNNLAIRIPNFFGADDGAVIAYGKFLQSCLQFFVIAWVFFLLVKALNKLHRKHEADLARAAEKAAEKTEKADKTQKSSKNPEKQAA